MVQTLETKVVSNEEIAPDIFAVKLESQEALEFKSGQWVNVMLEKDGKPYARPYSIASHPSESKLIEICLKRVEGGYVSNYLANKKVGDIVTLKGAFGIFLVKEPFEKDVIFVATGTGVAPFKPMIRDVLEKAASSKVWLFFGVRYDKDVFYKDYFEELEKKYPNFKFVPTLSKPSENWKGEKGYVQEHLKKNFSDGSNKQIYICGLPKMVDEVTKEAEQLGIPKEKIYFEKY